MAAGSKKAVVLLQLGGPDGPDAVQPFLHNLFCDPDIIDLPGAFLFRRGLARLISTRRAPRVIGLYEKIGGHSPILEQTEIQARALHKALNAGGDEFEVAIAMRYWHPFAEETVRELVDLGVEEVVLLPLYPHFSRTTTGSSFREWDRVARRLAPSLKVRRVESYFDHPLYIEAICDRIAESLALVPEGDRDKVHVVFSAHGTPLKLVREGDPYSTHIRKTYLLVVNRNSFGRRHHLCFQSKVGPQRWLEPSLTGMLGALAREGVSHVIVNPIAFVSDHIETLSEINIEAREEAHRLGITSFAMTAALLDHPKFIACLADCVRRMTERRS
jgi:ferrochelatase